MNSMENMSKTASTVTILHNRPRERGYPSNNFHTKCQVAGRKRGEDSLDGSCQMMICVGDCLSGIVVIGRK